MRNLNILNGDCAYSEWLKTNLTGEVLVWRENYLIGEIPTCDNLSEFNKIRATELNKTAPSLSTEEIFSELEEMNIKLLTLQKEDRVILWFDKCIFDKVMLSRILYLLYTHKIQAQIELIYHDLIWDKENFTKHHNTGTILSNKDLEFWQKEWLKLKGIKQKRIESCFYQSPIGVLKIVCEDGFLIYLERVNEPYQEFELSPLAQEITKQLDEYFAGTRKSFNIPLNLKGTEFQIKDWAALQTIPYGETRSYKDIAIQIGNPKGCRAVGLANNKNPISIIVPCHRVVGASGKLVGYASGLDMKQFLLDLEKTNQ